MMADETETAGLLPETGAADVGILDTNGSSGTSADEIDDGIVKNQGDSAVTNDDGIQKLDDESSSDDDDDEDTCNDDDMEEDDEEEEAEPTTRWDVFQALKQVTIPGNFCAGGCADGSTTITPSLPAAVGLRISNNSTCSKKSKASNSASTSIGSIPLPITDAHVQQLRTMSNKVDDESYHNVRQVDPDCVKITNPSWDTSLTKLLQTASLQLGVNPGHVRAELDMMLLFQRGSCIDRCRNAEEDDDVLGTLMIQLPSVFTGGEIRIWDNNDDEESDDEENSNGSDAESSNDDEDDGLLKTFDLGSGARSTAPFSCHYLCHYSDCDYEMKKIKSGTRLMLLYSLIYEGHGIKTTAGRRCINMAPLERSLEMLPRVDRLFAVPLSQAYGSVSLATKGLDALKVKDRGTIETIRAATKLGWKLMIVYATRTDVEKRRSEGYSDDYGYGERVTGKSSKTKLLRIVDENGKELPNAKEWLSKVVSLDSCEGSERGMVLARAPTPAPKERNDYYSYSDSGTEDCMLASAPPYSVADVWGKGKQKVKESNPYDYRYDKYETRATHTKSYSKSFLLAYDESSEFELKCLSGEDGTNEAVGQVCQAGDLDLLERFVFVLEAKTACQLSEECCMKLLRFIQSSSDEVSLGKKWKAEYSNKILNNLAARVEPTKALFDMINNSVERSGWEPLRESVSKILRNGHRKYLTTSTFLCRVSFLLKMRSAVSEFDRYEVDPTPSLFDNCFADFANSTWSSYGKDSNCPAIISNVSAMVDLYGWTSLVKRIVERIFDAILKSACDSIQWSIDLVQLCLKVKSSDGGAPAAETYLKRLFTALAPNFRYRFGNVDHAIDGFMDLFSLLFQYGNSDGFSAVGAWAIQDRDRFVDLVGMVKKHIESEGQACSSLPRDFLNKSLVQQKAPSVTPSNTSVPVKPSFHIEIMLEIFHSIAQDADIHGRIPLHHAVASEKCCFDTVKLLFDAHPKGASVVDPNTGLYPFMLAGSKGDADATFKLLLADPSLVCGALAVEGKKRKRSPSMN